MPEGSHRELAGRGRIEVGEARGVGTCPPVVSTGRHR